MSDIQTSLDIETSIHVVDVGALLYELQPDN